MDDLKSALDQAVNGTHLDDIPNHNDDSLFELADRVGHDGLRKLILAHARRLRDALEKLQ